MKKDYQRCGRCIQYTTKIPDTMKKYPKPKNYGYCVRADRYVHACEIGCDGFRQKLSKSMNKEIKPQLQESYENIMRGGLNKVYEELAYLRKRLDAIDREETRATSKTGTPPDEHPSWEDLKKMFEQLEVRVLSLESNKLFKDPEFANNITKALEQLKTISENNFNDAQQMKDGFWPRLDKAEHSIEKLKALIFQQANALDKINKTAVKTQKDSTQEYVESSKEAFEPVSIKDLSIEQSDAIQEALNKLRATHEKKEKDAYERGKMAGLIKGKTTAKVDLTNELYALTGTLLDALVHNSALISANKWNRLCDLCGRSYESYRGNPLNRIISDIMEVARSEKVNKGWMKMCDRIATAAGYKGTQATADDIIYSLRQQGRNAEKKDVLQAQHRHYGTGTACDRDFRKTIEYNNHRSKKSNFLNRL